MRHLIYILLFISFSANAQQTIGLGSSRPQDINRIVGQLTVDSNAKFKILATGERKAVFVDAQGNIFPHDTTTGGGGSYTNGWGLLLHGSQFLVDSSKVPTLYALRDTAGNIRSWVNALFTSYYTVDQINALFASWIPAYSDTSNYSDTAKYALNGGMLQGQIGSYYLNRANHIGTQAISTVTGLQGDLDGKEPTITGTGQASDYYGGDKTFHALNKAAVGLGNVDNTSDANKPISTATQSALDTKKSIASAQSDSLALADSLQAALARETWDKTLSRDSNASHGVYIGVTQNYVKHTLFGIVDSYSQPQYDSPGHQYPSILASRLGMTPSFFYVSGGTVLQYTSCNHLSFSDSFASFPHKTAEGDMLLLGIGFSDARVNNGDTAAFRVGYNRIVDSLIQHDAWRCSDDAIYTSGYYIPETNYVSQCGRPSPNYDTVRKYNYVIKTIAQQRGGIYADVFELGANHNGQYWIQTPATNVAHQLTEGHNMMANYILSLINNKVKKNGQALAVNGIAEFDRVKLNAKDTLYGNVQPVVIDSSGFIGPCADCFVPNNVGGVPSDIRIFTNWGGYFGGVTPNAAYDLMSKTSQTSTQLVTGNDSVNGQLFVDSINGSGASGGNIYVTSTSNAIKGSVVYGTKAKLDELLGTWYIGSTTLPATLTANVRLNIVSIKDTSNQNIFFTASANAAEGVLIEGRRRRGTNASPLAVKKGDLIIEFMGRGYTGTVDRLGGGWQYFAGNDYVSGSQGSMVADLSTSTLVDNRRSRFHTDSIGNNCLNCDIAASRNLFGNYVDNGNGYKNQFTGGIDVDSIRLGLYSTTAVQDSALRRLPNGKLVMFALPTSAGTGTVISASVVTANGFAGSVATSTTTPAITISTTVTGLLKGNGTAISAAIAGTDYLAPNSVITGATKTKITYDANGLVTAGANATTADISASTDKNYVTDAQQTVIGNTSGTNTGDQTSVTGNAGTATTLQTSRSIYGSSFNGSADISGPIIGTYGGTGVNNGSKTITVSGNTSIGSSTNTVSFATSGNTSVTLPTSGTLATLAGSETLTNKTLTSPVISSISNGATITVPSVAGTLSQYVEGNTASSSTPTPTGDARVNYYDVTALAAAATIGAPTGTPANHNAVIMRIKDNATARALSFNAIYRFSTDLAAPTTTVISKTLYLAFIYNSADSKWDCVTVINNY